jgi:hypothetical protein
MNNLRAIKYFSKRLLTSDPRFKETEIPERLSRSKSGKGLKNIFKKKFRHVCLCTPDLPAFAE